MQREENSVEPELFHGQRGSFIRVKAFEPDRGTL